LDDLDKGDRSRPFTVMDNLPLVDEWRRTLTLTERPIAARARCCPGR
jgi:hypothetical protein